MIERLRLGKNGAAFTRERGPHMRWIRIGVVALLAVAVVEAARPETKTTKPAKRTPREALSAFHELIGPWRATGVPEGTKAEKQKGFWVENLGWEWRFKGDDAWLRLTIDKGKYFVKGELRYLADKD